MDNQHKHIKGYRDLSAEEIALMNDAKAAAEQVGALVDRIDATPEPFVSESGRSVWQVRHEDGHLLHWLYCTHPDGAIGWIGLHRFDVRQLPAEFREGLEIEVLPGLPAEADWDAALTRQRAAHATAIRRALAAGYSFPAPTSPFS